MDVRISRMGWAVAAAVLATACSGGGSGGRLPVNAKAAAPAGTTSAAATGGLDLGDGVTITRVRLAVQRISLEGGAEGESAMTMKEDGSGGGSGSGGDGGGGSDDDGSGDGSGDGGSDEVRVGPFAVDLGADALAGGIRSVFDADVPAGTYRELRIAVGPVAGAAAGTALAGMAGQSVIVEGAVDGAPFTFASSLSSAQKLEATIQVAADGSSSAVTLTIDPHGWFRAADGARLDPTLDANRAAIEDAVRRSIGVEIEDEGEGEAGGGTDDGAGHG